MKQTKSIVNPSLFAFVAEIEEAILEGWNLDLEDNPPVTWGVVYECGLVRDVEEETPDPSAAPKPKMTRAEALAAARKAKAEKKLA